MPREVECVDCGCDIIYNEKLAPSMQRCDTCHDHHWGLCGMNCPIIESPLTPLEEEAYRSLGKKIPKPRHIPRGITG